MSLENHVIGWDLGGAHLKAAWLDGDGNLQQVQQIATPLWQGLGHLDQALQQLADMLPLEHADHYLTMTGELVDAFDNRRQGVEQLAARMAERLPSGRLRLYAGSVGFVRAVDAGRVHANIASANWYATAAWVAQQIGNGMLIDLGSTSADLLVLRRGWVDHRGYSDRQRMASGELLYQGVVRTPLMALVQQLPFAGDWHGVAAELFANMADVYRILGWLPADADLYPTCDGRGKDPESSMRRLARMLGADLEDATAARWTELARYIAERQLEQLMRALQRQLSRGVTGPLVGAGVGRFLVQRLARRLEREYLDIDTLIGTPQQPGLAPAVCAPAFAVAKLGLQEVLACAS